MPPIVPDAPWWANVALLMLGLVLSAATALLVVWLPLRATRKKLDRIDTQVSNSHKTNLRDDVTEVIKAVASLQEHLDGIKEDVAEIKYDTSRIDRRMDAIATDVQDERKERLRHETFSNTRAERVDARQQELERQISTLSAASPTTAPEPPRRGQ